MYLPHSITVMFCKTTSFKTTHILLLLKIRSLNMKSVFSQVHHQCKLHSEYSSLVNVATTKKRILTLSISYFGGEKKNSTGHIPPLYPHSKNGILFRHQ